MDKLLELLEIVYTAFTDLQDGKLSEVEIDTLLELVKSFLGK